MLACLEDLNVRNDALNRQVDEYNRVGYRVNRENTLAVADRNRTVDALQAGQENLAREGFGINRQRDAIAAQAELRQQEQADLQYRRSVRDAIRQGTVASATGLAQATNRGGGQGSTQAAGLQANAITAARLAISDATQAKGGQDILRGLSRQDRLAQIQARLLGEQNFELGTLIRGQNAQVREIGLRNTMVREDLGEATRLAGVESRELGVAARGINFGLTLSGFDVADQQFALNDRTFGINRNISDIYLNAQDQNASLVDQAAGLNQNLLTQNTATQDVLYGLQEDIYGLGATNSSLASQAAAYGGLTAIGGGLTSFGGSVVGNAGRIGQVAGSLGSLGIGNAFGGGINQNTSFYAV